MKQGTLRRGGLIGAALLLTACGSGEAVAAVTPAPGGQSAPASASRACYGNDQPACNLRTYQVMVESFVDGDGSANYGVGYGPSRHNGDLQGIIDSLDHIKSLNVNAIWLTRCLTPAPARPGTTGWMPPATSPATSSTWIPTSAATPSSKLVDGAHQRGLYVFLDGVFGHVNKVGVSKPSPEGRLPALKSGGAGYPGQLVDYSQPESLAYFKEVARYWVEQYGIDGWRLDQAYQLGLDDWRAIRSEVARPARRARPPASSGAPSATWWGSVEGRRRDPRPGLWPERQPGALFGVRLPLRYGLVQALAVEESGKGGQGASVLDASWNKVENYPTTPCPT